MIVPMIVSKAAELDKPAPTNTSLVMNALKPPILYPNSLNLDTTPLINPSEVPSSSSFLSRSFK